MKTSAPIFPSPLSLADARWLDAKHYIQVWGERPLNITGGHGCYLTASDGRDYLDLIGGIAVSVLGHGHPALTRAICRQAGQVLHCSNYYYNSGQAILAARLAGLAAELGMAEPRVFLGNSGAEANEGAIKLARGYFYHQGRPRTRIVTALQSFHGRTLATATATGQPKYSAAFAPLPDGFVYVPYNDCDALRAAVDDMTCAVLLEPIQGESGVRPATQAYLACARAVCDATGARLIMDEIQTGMGRTGSFFASEQFDLRPDIVTLAKGLAGGVPIGALIADAETARGFQPGDHGTTFGGNPLACAAANAVLDVYAEEQLPERAARVGRLIRTALQAVQAAGAPIREVRGMGLMIGVGLAQPCAVAAKVHLQEQGYLVGSVGADTLRLLPPLVLAEDTIAPFAQALAATLKEVASC